MHTGMYQVRYAGSSCVYDTAKTEADFTVVLVLVS